MAAAVTEQLETLLTRTTVLVLEAGEDRWAHALTALAAQARRAGGDAEAQRVVRSVLGLYAGAGSFSDLVLQNRDGVRPEQAELDPLRQRLFEAVRQRLG